MVTATAFKEAYSAGKMTALSYAQACLQEIERSDGQIQAWEHLVPDAVRQMAEQADADPAADNMKPLRGVPVGIKDIIDTCDAPCKWGLAELAGRQPEADATLVTSLRRAGAIIFGKTVTTEFATLRKAGPVIRMITASLQVGRPAAQLLRWPQVISHWQLARRQAGL